MITKKIFDKTWSPHFVPFSHGKRGQNVATKFCQKMLYCDFTLEALGLHTLVLKNGQDSEVFVGIRQKVFESIAY